MDKRTSYITNNSIEGSGLPTDFKKALAEYIWNGFDAGATHVSLDFDHNEVGFITFFTISDNGSGISMKTIDATFGQFLDSQKKSYPNKKGFVKGRKGKGRYAFSTFANSCNWLTTYAEQNGEHLQYNIVINKGDLQHFGTVNNTLTQKSNTGTVVTFNDFFALNGESLRTKEFLDYLACEFGWYLYLKRAEDFKILVNGERLSYDHIVGHAESYHQTIGDYEFEIDFIRWDQRIGDKYYFYFLTDQQKEAFRKYTSFNNKAIDYHHSVYVKSNFFNDFHETADEVPVLAFSGKNQTDPTFKMLVRELLDIVTAQEKEFIRDIQADRLLREYETNEVLPMIAENEAEQQGRQDLKDLIRELYCAEPRLFHKLNMQQQKVMVGLLNILLSTNQKLKILAILESISELTEEEHGRVAMVLQ